jgi:hypothetical protein
VNKSSQAITFGSLPDFTFPVSLLALSATSSSGLPVSYSSSDQAVATISGQLVTVLTPGTVTITASQNGSTNYSPATPVVRTFCIKPPKPVIAVNFENASAPVLTSSNSDGSQWYKNNTIIPGATAANFTATEAGEYKTLTTIKTCSSAFSEPFVVLITSLSTEFNPLSIYPNPAKESLIVTGIAKGSELTIHSETGKKLYTTTAGSSPTDEVEIDISRFDQGIYLLLTRDQNGIRVMKFTKK